MQFKNFLLSVLLAVGVSMSCTQTDLNVQDNLLTTSNTLKSATMNKKYIVTLHSDEAIALLTDKHGKVKAKAKDILAALEIDSEVEEVYGTALQGFSVQMAPGQAKKLEEHQAIKMVEEDQAVSINRGKPIKPPKPPTTTEPPTTTLPPPTDNIPWGITRVGGGQIYTGTGRAWVIDSGVDLTHPDLNVDAASGVSFVSYTTSPNDDNGHGTHVAGTIAAKKNGTGVVGVAAGAVIIPLKVLDSTGCGSFSVVLAGIDYVAAHGVDGDVANISIGGGISPTIDAAVVRASALVKFALAAGNETDNVLNHSPARAEGPNIYTVSAMYSGDTWASFSNYGTAIDFCAPGVSIYSTYKNGAYASMSGTSMAAPHVAGLLLWGPVNIDGYVQNDPDGNPDPIAHR